MEEAREEASGSSDRTLHRAKKARHRLSPFPTYYHSARERYVFTSLWQYYNRSCMPMLFLVRRGVAGPR